MLTNFLFTINSPLEQFEVINLISLNLPILGYWNLTLTNLGLYSIIILTIVIGLHILGNNETNLIPSRWSISLESSFASLSSMVRSQIGNSNEQYLPFIYSLFFFIIIANLTGNVPYSFTITTSLIVSIGLSLSIFLGVTIYALYLHKIKFFSYFIPSGTPLMLVPLLVLIELISYFARSLSLGVRLFANTMSGHTLVKILSTFLTKLFTSSLLISILTLIPFTLFVAILGLELAVSIIQAYVFVILTCSYIKDAIYLH
jgi:F-type H+-transporting ATPase subunit a